VSDLIERPPCPRSSVYKLRCPHEDWAAARIKELERERDEALQLTESCSTLKDMASACIDGAVWKHGAEKAAARIKELETKIEWLEGCNLRAGEQANRFRDQRDKLDDDREVIEAATTERCASHIEKLGWTAAANSIREMKAETIK